MRTCVRMLVACVLIPRFELRGAAAGGLERLAGRAVAIAPQSAAGTIGEVPGAAQAFGVRSGMALGEALARCPRSSWSRPTRLRVAAAGSARLGALEGIGAGVDPQRPGLARFPARRRAARACTTAATSWCWRRRGALSTASPGWRPPRPASARWRRRSPPAPGAPRSWRGDARAYLAGLPVALLRSRAVTEPPGGDPLSGLGSRRSASLRRARPRRARRPLRDCRHRSSPARLRR